MTRNSEDSQQQQQQGLPTHKTMVKPDAKTIPLLTGWVRPRHAYVLLEMPGYAILDGGVKVPQMQLVTLNAEARAEIMHQVDHYLDKGARLLDYGNFPKLADRNPYRSAKAMHYSQGTGMDPWLALERHVETKMRADKGWATEKEDLLNTIDALHKKLADAQSKRASKEEAKAQV